jgi:hypothetical protein
MEGLVLKRAVAGLLLLVGVTTLNKALGPAAGHAVHEAAQDVVGFPASAATAEAGAAKH